MRLASAFRGKGGLALAIYLGVLSLAALFSITGTGSAQVSSVTPAPSGGDQMKQDQTQILALVDSLSTAIQNRDSKAVVACFVARLPDYYQTLSSPDFKLDSLSTTPTIDLILHKALVGKLNPIVQKSPTLIDFVQNSLAASGTFSENVGQIPQISNFLGDVEVNGDSAVAPLKAANKHFPVEFVFSRERGQWKIDPFPLFASLQLVLAFDQMKNNRTTDQESDLYVRQIPDFANQVKQSAPAGVNDSGLETPLKPAVPISPTPTPGVKLPGQTDLGN